MCEFKKSLWGWEREREGVWKGGKSCDSLHLFSLAAIACKKQEFGRHHSFTLPIWRERETEREELCFHARVEWITIIYPIPVFWMMTTTTTEEVKGNGGGREERGRLKMVVNPWIERERGNLPRKWKGSLHLPLAGQGGREKDDTKRRTDCCVHKAFSRNPCNWKYFFSHLSHSP